MENFLKEKEHVIISLEAKLKDKLAQKPVISMPKGDILDEMIG